MCALSDILAVVAWAIWLILLSGAIFYAVVAWNVRKPKPVYDFFPRVSVMAYAWQSGNVIERKIKNFLDQDYPRDRFEVIIYDNDSTDETREICLGYEEQGLIKYFRSAKPHDRKAPVLDQAIGEVACGEIIALTDPDGVCEKDWLKKIVQPFKDSTVGAVSGVTHCGNYYRNLFTKLRAIEDEWWYNVCVLGKSGKVRISDFHPICGANYALRKTAWESVGRSHGRSLVEDYEMTFRLYNKGWKIAPADANVWQEEVEKVAEYVRQRRRWYQPSVKKVVKGKNKVGRVLGALPYSMQATAFLSFLYFMFASVYEAMFGGPSPNISVFIAPFVITCLALTYGLVKAGKAKLLPYLLLFLTFDSALQITVFLETKIRHRRERHWVKLGEGEYYHVGSEMRMS